MYQVTCYDDRANFSTLSEAKAYAEKASWIANQTAEIRCPDGKRITVDVNKRS
jgi:hypothetical protein